MQQLRLTCLIWPVAIIFVVLAHGEGVAKRFVNRSLEVVLNSAVG